MRVAGLFAGIGGFELGMSQAGCRNILLCEIDEDARTILRHRFGSVKIVDDVEKIEELPLETDVVCAGFPCQNLSMAGDKKGINGTKSKIVDELVRLLRNRPVPWVVIENVYFMLYLDGGEGMRHLLDQLEKLKYRWAYRVVDSRSFGLAQRRRRLYIVASLKDDPRDVLLADDAGKIDWPKPSLTKPIGFYWTEGNSGHGLTGDAIPPLKTGSGLNIPSPPAVLLPDGRIVTPPIEATERLQGFPDKWTSVLRKKHLKRRRWRLVGNAVSVPIATWIGERLQTPGRYKDDSDTALDTEERWPIAAWNIGEGRMKADVSEYPVKKQRGRISAYATDDWPDLSPRALNGFVTRARASTLRYPDGFLEALENRLEQLMK